MAQPPTELVPPGVDHAAEGYIVLRVHAVHTIGLEAIHVPTHGPAVLWNVIF